MDARDLALSTVGKKSKKKIARKKLYTLGVIKDWGVIDNSKNMIKDLKCQM